MSLGNEMKAFFVNVVTIFQRHWQEERSYGLHVENNKLIFEMREKEENGEYKVLEEITLTVRPEDTIMLDQIRLGLLSTLEYLSRTIALSMAYDMDPDRVRDLLTSINKMKNQIKEELDKEDESSNKSNESDIDKLKNML